MATQNTNPTDNIFSGLKVVDFASFVAGPGAAVILSDFGADVIKVEPPKGELWRIGNKIPPQPQSKSPYMWHLNNRNKRGITLDLKSPDAGKILERLVKWADVLIVNTPHPASLGSAMTHPLITTDFSESQIELVTGVHASSAACLEELTQIHQVVYRNIGDELLWGARWNSDTISGPTSCPEKAGWPFIEMNASAHRPLGAAANFTISGTCASASSTLNPCWNHCPSSPIDSP